MVMETTSEKFNPTQLHLLQLFARPMSDEELDELKRVLVDFYTQRIDQEVDTLWERGIVSQETLDQRLKEKSRSRS
jgi:hypothetical protein